MSINFNATQYLRTFTARQEFDGGLAFARQLDQVRLDYSLASLARLDRLLSAIRSQLKPVEASFCEPPANQNFLYLLAFYCGETVARCTDASRHWYNYEQMLALSPGFAAFGQGFYSSAVVQFNQCGPHLAGHEWLPLNAILHRLFVDDGKSVAQTAQSVIERIQADLPALPADLPAALKFGHAGEQALLTPRLPPLLANDPDWQACFGGHRFLANKGKAVWGCVVQANLRLYEEGDDDLPAVLIYDPQGAVSPLQLRAVAGKLSALKNSGDALPADLAEDVKALVLALRAEAKHFFGMDVPPSIGVAGLKISWLMVQRRSLPGKVLALTRLPLIVAAERPETLLLLPWPWWDQALVDQFCYKPDAPTQAIPETIGLRREKQAAAVAANTALNQAQAAGKSGAGDTAMPAQDVERAAQIVLAEMAAESGQEKQGQGLLSRIGEMNFPNQLVVPCMIGALGGGGWIIQNVPLNASNAKSKLAIAALVLCFGVLVFGMAKLRHALDEWRNE